jgi:mannose-6-phosphate isomerase-like protein (cupin superfamily)
MSSAQAPIRRQPNGRLALGGGAHIVARQYRKGVRLDTHKHREAQLVFATRGTMQVTTPKGRWLVPPDRAVWVPARLEHSIDVLADIEMRTLYFELAWPHSFRCRRRRGAGAAELVLAIPGVCRKSARWRNRSAPRHLGAHAVAAVLNRNPAQLQELVPARAHCRINRETVRWIRRCRSSRWRPISAIPVSRHSATRLGKSPADADRIC